MPTAFNIYKVTSFPASPQADAIYINKVGSRSIIKVTDSSGVYMSNEQGLADVLGIGNVAAGDMELVGSGGGSSLLVNSAAGSYGIGDIDHVNKGVALVINDAVSKLFLKGIANGVGNGILTIASDGQVQQRTLAQIVGDLGITPIAASNGQVVYMDASDDPVGSADLTFDGSELKVSKSSGLPSVRVVRGGSIVGVLSIPSTNYSFTGTDFKDMAVLFGNAPGIGLVSGDNGIKVKNTAAGGIEFWVGYGEKLRLTNSGAIFPGLATWGNPKLLTVGYGGGVGSMDVPTLASGSYTPSSVSVSNCSSPSFSGCVYSRVGNIVTVAGRVSLSSIAASSAVSCEFSLPVASANTIISGTCWLNPGIAGNIGGNTTTAVLFFNSASGGNNTAHFQFMYEIK